MKFIPFFFIKLLFFFVPLQFLLCTPFYWAGAEEAHGKQSHLGMAKMLHLRMGWCAPGVLAGMGLTARVGAVGRRTGRWIHRGDGERVNLPAIHEKKLKHEITLDSFMHLVIQTHQPFELTSSAVTVGGICIYV